MTKTFWQRVKPAIAPFNWETKTDPADSETIWEVVPTAITNGGTLLDPPVSGQPRNQNDITTKCLYSDFKLTFSFRCPNMRTPWNNCNSVLKGPHNWGNSGVKILDKDGYEVQILDSFGATLGDASKKTNLGGCRATGTAPAMEYEVCGAIYKTIKPDANTVKQAVNDAAKPNDYIPDGEWNTLEIEFMSARFEWDAAQSKFIKKRCSTISVTINDTQRR